MPIGRDLLFIPKPRRASPWIGAAIAQLVEHLIRNEGVGGSNPSCGTNHLALFCTPNILPRGALGVQSNPRRWASTDPLRMRFSVTLAKLLAFNQDVPGSSPGALTKEFQGLKPVLRARLLPKVPYSEAIRKHSVEGQQESHTIFACGPFGVSFRRIVGRFVICASR